MTVAGRTWALITLNEEVRQYGGNAGYEDELERTYRYDSAVPNHKQLNQGDLILIRDAKQMVGVARIERITSSRIIKVRQRCPECKQIGLKFRKTKNLSWRCSNGHEFRTPILEEISVIGYEAHYGNSFVATPGAISVLDLKMAALRPNDQLSIEELDLSRIEGILTSRFPETRSLILGFFEDLSLDVLDARSDTSFDKYAREVIFLSSMADTRESILRSIKIRRGQKVFRNKLIKRYGPRCMASGCTLLDVVEAAHIDPYRNFSDNHVENGLLLRADIHTLFDLNLFAIDPNGLKLKFHPDVLRAGYESMQGQFLLVKDGRMPAIEPIEKRWRAFLERLLK